jgi:hypothetical protein
VLGLGAPGWLISWHNVALGGPGRHKVALEGTGLSERSHCIVLFRSTDGGTRLELTVEGLSGELTAEQMRVGWT